MWRSSSSSRLLFRTLLGGSVKSTRFGWAEHPIRPWRCCFSASASPSPVSVGGAPDPSRDSSYGVGGEGGDAAAESISSAEAKKMMRLVNVESLKRKLGMEGEEVIGYEELLEACERIGVARSLEEAAAFARVLDEAGVVLLFRDKVYLHPEKVVDLVRKAVPLVLMPENDPRKEELKQLLKEKEEIDMLAHRQVHRILWSGLGFFVFQLGLFFRLTFWEFSWDLMEPVAFFTTTTGLIVGYAYFLFTSRDPTYQDIMKRLFLSRQRKLIQKKHFNIDRLRELERHSICPLDHTRGGLATILD